MTRHSHPRAARRPLVVGVLLAAILVIPGVACATTVVPLDLEALTAAAGRVFMGHVIEVRSGHDGHGLPVTWTTFAVDEGLKGTAATTIEIKQLGGAATSPDGAIYRVPALPSYAVGDEVILFLHPESREGFTSPVGLGQGRFRIRRGDGPPVAENDVGNTNLTAAAATGALPVPGAGGAGQGARSVAPANAGAAPIPVDDLLTRVRVLSGAAR